jgi:hypothetical protein
VLFDIAERYAQTMLVEVAYFTAYAAFGLPSVHLVRAMVDCPMFCTSEELV